MGRIYKQQSVLHAIDSEEIVPIGADNESKTLSVNLRIWDTEALQWIRMTKGMADTEYPSFYTNRLEWTDGNCIYKGSHADLNASIDDTSWYIFRYDYDASDNCTMIRFSTGAWSNRAGLWS